VRRLNLSIDDVSPHEMSGLEVLASCERILQRHPGARFTLFVPTAYWRTIYIEGRPDTRTPAPLRLADFPEFCARLRELPSANFEIGYHGHFHGLPGRSNNDEFRYTGELEAATRLDAMFRAAAEAGLADVFQPLFRPPAMRINPETIAACEAAGIRCLALTRKSPFYDAFAGADEAFGRVVYANVWHPEEPLDKVAPGADVAALFHACTWDASHLGEERVSELLAWLERNPVEFAFIEELLG